MKKNHPSPSTNLRQHVSRCLLALALVFLPLQIQAQLSEKVNSMDTELRGVQKDFFALQKDLLTLEKQVLRSGIDDTTREDLKKLQEIDLLKSKIDNLSSQLQLIKQTPSSATGDSVNPNLVASLQKSVAQLEPQISVLKERIDKLEATPTTVSEGSPTVSTSSTPSDVSDLVSKLASDSTAQTLAINIVWTLVAGFLVMFMQAGFAMVETGFTRSKNAAHTMSMNFMVYVLGMLGYWLSGFAIQFGGTGAAESVSTVATLGPDVAALLNHEIGITLNGHFFGLVGNKGFCLGPEYLSGGIFTLFLFQMVFMDTTATIPTGSMAERWKFLPFCFYAVAVGALIYPIYGNWVWGGGWLAALGKNFQLGHGHVDFAGSSVVHLCGGVLALVGAKILGPRHAKYNRDGSANPIPGHNIPMGIVGTFILAFGWFGFNAGSTLAGMDIQIGVIATNTMLASAAGAATGMITTWRRFGRPDPSFMCNGMLAGLVAITGPCAFVESWAAVLIGGVAGILVVVSVFFVEEKLKIDDPVGAISVHGINGAWGVLALGLFANGRYGAGWNSVGAESYLGKAVVAGKSGGVTGLFYGDTSQFYAQCFGTLACIVAVGIMGFIVFGLLEKIFGNRVSLVDEIGGLDIPEIGTLAYPPDVDPQIR